MPVRPFSTCRCCTPLSRPALPISTRPFTKTRPRSAKRRPGTAITSGSIAKSASARALPPSSARVLIRASSMPMRHRRTHYFDRIDSIDIIDVNAGSHGRYFATNFDPEINFSEFTGTVWSWQNSQWTPNEMFEVSRTDDLAHRRYAQDLSHRPRRGAFALGQSRRARHPFLDGLWRALYQRLHRAEKISACSRRSSFSLPRARKRCRSRSSRPCCPIRLRSRPTMQARPSSAT